MVTKLCWADHQRTLKSCCELEIATNGARPRLTPLDQDVCTVDKTGNKGFMPRLFDHVDLRVLRLAEVTAFYELLLPALGFTWASLK